LKESKLTQAQPAKALSITQARVSDIKAAKSGQFSLDMLVRLASRAGLSRAQVHGGNAMAPGEGSAGPHVPHYFPTTDFSAIPASNNDI
jgi:hypothetical protein